MLSVKYSHDLDRLPLIYECSLSSTVLIRTNFFINVSFFRTDKMSNKQIVSIGQTLQEVNTYVHEITEGVRFR